MKKNALIFLIILLFAASLYIGTSPQWRAYLKIRFQKIETGDAYEDYFTLLDKRSSFINRNAKANLTKPILSSFETSLQSKEGVTISSSIIKLTLVISDQPKSKKKKEKLQIATQKAKLLLENYAIILSSQKSQNDNLKEFAGMYLDILPNNSKGYYYQSLSLLRDRRSLDAMNSLAQALTRKPFLPDAFSSLIKLYNSKGKYPKITQLVDQHEEKMPANPILYTIAGRAYHRQGKALKAGQFLKQALDLQADNFQNHLMLAQIGEILDRSEWIEHYLNAWKIQPLKTQIAREWVEFKLRNKEYEKVIEFFEGEGNDLAANLEFQVLYLTALVELNQVQRFEKFLAQNRLNSSNHPVLLFFQGLLAQQKKDWKTARHNFEEFVAKNGASSSRKEQALNHLIEIARNRKESGSVRVYLRQLMKLRVQDPSIHARIAQSFLDENRKEKALGAYLYGINLFAEEDILMVPASKILYELKAYLKVIDLVQSYTLVAKDSQLSILLANSYLKTGNLKGAQYTLLRAIAAGSLKRPLEKNLQAVLDSKKAEDFLEEDLDIIRQREKGLLSGLQTRVDQAQKSTLPPAPNLSSKVKIQGKFKRSFLYEGMAELMIPEDSEVLLIEPMTEEQMAFFPEDDSRTEFYLARYEGNLHRIHASYVDIETYPQGELMGKGIIANLDENYKTMAKINENFIKDTPVTVHASKRQGSNRSIVLNEENVVSFLGAPDESYTVQVGPRIYHDVNPRMIDIDLDFQFLNDYHYSDIVDVPIENRRAIFGPDGGSITIFQESDGDFFPVHEFPVGEVVQGGRYAKDFLSLSYRGYLVVDVNSDSILDYLSMWQSSTQPEEGILAVSASVDQDSFKNYLMPTRLEFIKNYKSKRRISPLNFLKDLDQDRRIEFILYHPVHPRGNKKRKIPFYEVYHPRGRDIRNVTSQFRGFLREQKEELRRLKDRKKDEIEDEVIYQEWFQGYVRAMQKLNRFTRGDL